MNPKAEIAEAIGPIAYACALIEGATLRLDAMRDEAARSLQEYARTRHDLEALIDRLIEGLDQIDAGEAEGDDADTLEGDELDFGEAVNEDGGDVSDEPHDPEEDGRESDVPLDWKESCSGILLSFKRGQLVHAHAHAREGRAAR